jgi:hypothetical protein
MNSPEWYREPFDRIVIWKSYARSSAIQLRERITDEGWRRRIHRDKLFLRRSLPSSLAVFLGTGWIQPRNIHKERNLKQNNSKIISNTGWARCIRVLWNAWRGLRATFVNGSWKCIQIFPIPIYEYPIYPAVSEIQVKDSIRDCCTVTQKSW